MPHRTRQAMGIYRLLSLLLLPAITICGDFDSYEIKQLEVTPIYDIILFNDIADVIKDFNNELVNQNDAKSLTESESHENIQDLLMEYQHYLDKAHRQRVDYLQKVTSKNKVPLLRHERYPKKKPAPKSNIDSYYNPFTSNFVFPRTFPNIPPFLGNSKGDSKFSFSTSHFNSPIVESAKDQVLQSKMRSCYCKPNEIPCNCGCKECIIQLDSELSNSNYKLSDYVNSNKNTDPFIKQDRKKKPDNDFKIRIKVDIKLPKILEQLANMFGNNDSSMPETHSPNESSKNLFSPYFNFPNSAMFRYDSLPTLSESIPVQRITIHKKKKYRTNSNKKHKKKSLNTHINASKNTTLEITSESPPNEVINETYTQNTTEKTESIKLFFNETAVNQTLNADNQTKEFISLTLNISNNRESQTEEIGRLENSIETDYIKTKDNFTTVVRDKRELVNSTSEPDLSVIPLNGSHDKKIDKLLEDSSLTYWPESQTSLPNNTTKDINSVILNIEKRKPKLNMSKEIMRNNHSMALEKAIFGDVDWNDVDTIAPVFISFVGKYVHGVLTFCSDAVCHSMKCIHKTCIHRKCDSTSRYNNIGHCMGNNSTDSVAKLESTMNLPSNLAFEIVDILQDKMLGKMYGKVTICIGLKCITFVASKKTVIKNKCTSKEINAQSECPFKY